MADVAMALPDMPINTEEDNAFGADEDQAEKKSKSAVQKRFDQLTREKYEAQRQAQELREQLTAERTKKQQLEARIVEQDGSITRLLMLVESLRAALRERRGHGK